MTTSIEQPVRAQLLDFLSARTKTAVTTDLDLFASGLVSSLFAMELVVFVESTFAVTVGPEDLKLDTFRTVDRITELVHRLRGGQP